MKKLDIDIANTIINELGGKCFLSKISGKHHLLNTIDNGLQIKYPVKFARKGVNCIHIILNEQNNYTMQFFRLKKIYFRNSLELICQFNDVHRDSIKTIFNNITGIETDS